MATDYLFVYGTLRSDCDSNAYRRMIAPGCRLLGRASLVAELYDLGQYPGVLPADDPARRVLGEVFSFNPHSRLLQVLDDYEGCSDHYPQPREYVRRRTPVILDNDSPQATLDAWVYFYNWKVNKAMRIASGDYLKR